MPRVLPSLLLFALGCSPEPPADLLGTWVVDTAALAANPSLSDLPADELRATTEFAGQSLASMRIVFAKGELTIIGDATSQTVPYRLRKKGDLLEIEVDADHGVGIRLEGTRMVLEYRDSLIALKRDDS